MMVSETVQCLFQTKRYQLERDNVARLARRPHKTKIQTQILLSFLG